MALARRHGLPVVAVAFDVAGAECRARNNRRPRPVPAKVLAGQLRRWAEVRDELAGDGFDAVHPAGPVRVVHPELVTAPAAAARQQEAPLPLSFGLQIATFDWPDGDRPPAGVGGPRRRGGRLQQPLGHGPLRPDPPGGPALGPMLDSWTTLGFLAGHTTRATLGTMVTGITYRNVAHLAKIVATLDVLSGGRAVCGLGRRVVRTGAQGVRVRLPAGPRAPRPARGRPPGPAAAVGAGGAGVRGQGHLGARGHLPTPARSRSTSRSWSAARARSGRCAWWPATPTPATSSATRPPSATSSTCSGPTAPTSAGTRPRSRSPTCPRSSTAPSRTRSAATGRWPRPASRTAIVRFDRPRRGGDRGLRPGHRRLRLTFFVGWSTAQVSGRQRALEVGEQVVDVLDADGEPDQAGIGGQGRAGQGGVAHPGRVADRATPPRPATRPG